MKKIIEPCGLHCIKMNHLGVTIGNQTILEDVNMHIHCGTLTLCSGLPRAACSDAAYKGCKT